MNARLALAALLLAATAFASAAERDSGSITIGGGAVVADSGCSLNSDSDCDTFASAAERDSGSIMIGGGAVVADSGCGLKSDSDCDLNSDHTSWSSTLWDDGRGAISCSNCSAIGCSNCDVTLDLDPGEVAAMDSTVQPTFPPKS